MKDVRDALFVAHATDGKLVRRPMSPHLGVYRLQLSMVLSGMYRVSGIVSSIATLLLVWWLVAAATGPKPFAVVQRVAANPLGLLVLFGWTLAVVFHTVGGLRHLAWDAGYGFAKNVYNRTGPLVIVVSVLLTLLIWVAGFVLWQHGAGAAGTGR